MGSGVTPIPSAMSVSAARDAKGWGGISAPRRRRAAGLTRASRKSLCRSSRGGDMPLTRKGGKILRALKQDYGEKKGKNVFYASINKGTIRGAHRTRR